MRYWCDFILHFLLSNSRHGTHSPFVYKMADKVIYNNLSLLNLDGQSKSERLIYALKLFFKAEINDEVLEFDINCVSFDEVLTFHHNFPIVILKNLYKQKEAKRKWVLLQNDQSVLVTIDLFYFGILIKREGQRKENFKLRFPFSKY